MLFDQITQDYKRAMKDKDNVKSATLSFLRAQLKNVMIDKKTEQPVDTDVIAVIKKQVKQRQESISQFEQGGRIDLAEKEKKELSILQAYLPEPMSSEQIKSIVEQVVAETEATSLKDMGRVMKAVLDRVAGQADGKQVSELVKEKLSGL